VSSGLGGYAGIIGAHKLGDHHQAQPGLKSEMRRSNYESVMFPRKQSLSHQRTIEQKPNENSGLDLNDYRANMYKETLSPNISRTKLRQDK
jgi:hypothetical protein